MTEPDAQTTDEARPTPATASTEVRHRLTREQQRRGGRMAGQTGRTVALIGLGGEPVPTLSLRTSADRFAILEATLAAVVKGSTSGMTAASITAIVKLANEMARGDQEDQIRELERRLNELVIEAPRAR